MDRIAEGLFKGMRAFIAICLALMVVMVFGNVVLRYAFNSGITVAEELSRWLFIWMTFVGAVIALRNHTHLGMDSMVAKLPPGGKKACFVLSNILMLGCVVIFAKGSWDQTLINLETHAPASGLSSGWYYGVGLFFCVFAFPILVRNIYQAVTGKVSGDKLIQIRESEDIHKLETNVVAASGSAQSDDEKRERAR